MKTLNLRIKQFAFTAVVAILAIGTSAYTQAESKLLAGNHRFYNISGVEDSTDPTNFVYIDETDALCDPLSEGECSVLWNVTNTPTTGQNPTQAGSPTRVTTTGSAHPGVYDPN